MANENRTAPMTPPENVDGDYLMLDLVSAIERFVALRDGAAFALALWIVFTYGIDASDISPATSPLRVPKNAAAKTTLLKILSKLVCRPRLVSYITPSALFRSIEFDQPTLLIDEADTFVRENEAIRGLLNSGHEREAASVMVNVRAGDSWVPTSFSTFTPIAIASIGRLSDTIEDRSIVIEMRRKRPDERSRRVADKR